MQNVCVYQATVRSNHTVKSTIMCRELAHSSQLAQRQISIKQVNVAGSEGVTRTRKHDVNISV